MRARVFALNFAYTEETKVEIERKFLVKKENLPRNLKQYPRKVIQQGYLCTDPVVRIRQSNDSYYLTYKSKGLLAREEYNLPLTKEAYEHLLSKIDGRLIKKKRYMLPLGEFTNDPLGLTIELDLFEGDLAPLLLAEVEFPDEPSANAFTPPSWFGEDVTFSGKYHNSYLSLK